MSTRHQLGDPALIAAPMHGQWKLLAEGYRTRDGHFIEWLGRNLVGVGPVEVVSRPEPVINFRSWNRARRAPAANTVSRPFHTFRIPTSRNRQRWWVDSASAYGGALENRSSPVLAWNPFFFTKNVRTRIASTGTPTGFDLLDDWTVHYAFSALAREVDDAYRAAFDTVDFVTANSEATVDLARRYGRTDAYLVPNGCDPERFDHVSVATGRTTVGYVGKIGKRLDLSGIIDTMRALPEVEFVFAGPILDEEYRHPLSSAPNARLLGDVHYERVPELLREFDIGWVPHRVGAGEVGGDVIKTYEYRAAGLPVLTTPVLGASSRGLTNVYVYDVAQHAEWIRSKRAGESRVPRELGHFPPEATWSAKTDLLLRLLGLKSQ